VAAELAGMHAQTLRTYDRLGLVSPQRTSGGGRRYSQHESNCCAKCSGSPRTRGQPRRHQTHHRADNQVDALQSRLQEMAVEIEALRANQRRDIAVVPKSTALVVWQPRKFAENRSLRRGLKTG